MTQIIRQNLRKALPFQQGGAYRHRTALQATLLRPASVMPYEEILQSHNLPRRLSVITGSLPQRTTTTTKKKIFDQQVVAALSCTRMSEALGFHITPHFSVKSSRLTQKYIEIHQSIVKGFQQPVGPHFCGTLHGYSNKLGHNM